MRKLLIIAGTATLVAVLGVAAIGAVAFAQDVEDGPLFDFRVRMKDLIAERLGVSVEKYDAAVESAQGQVLAEAVEEGVLTQEQADKMQERFEEGGRFGKMPHELHGSEGQRGGMRGSMRGGFMGAGPLEAAAEVLDMTVEDLQAELENGKTIAELAGSEEKLQAIVTAYTAQVAEQLAAAVEDGRMTQEQADTMLERMGEQIQNMLEGEFHFRGAPGGSRGGFPGKFGPGGERPPFPGQNDA